MLPGEKTAIKDTINIGARPAKGREGETRSSASLVGVEERHRVSELSLSSVDPRVDE